MAKATKTIRQSLGYKPAHAAWFAATKDLFNQVTAFYFEVSTCRIFLTNYGFHVSSSYVTSSQEIDYVGVSEAAGL
jgi:predicted Zn-dependent protease